MISKLHEELPCTTGETAEAGPLAWLLHPVSEHHFWSRCWEREPLHVSQRPANYYAPRVQWSTARMLEVAAASPQRCPEDISVTRVDPNTSHRVNGLDKGRLNDTDMRHWMEKGWSVRFLCPQQHSPGLSLLIADVEEYFSCGGGANSYWTPSGAQGFAPHYDDVDVLMLQLEGEKQWRLYPPRNNEEELPRFSSKDFDLCELRPSVLSLTLRQGELLFLPRGWIHQGWTAGQHSLHVTLSVSQRHTWADFVSTMVAREVEKIAEKDLSWRRGIPRSWWSALGSAASKNMRAKDEALPASRRFLLRTARRYALQLSKKLFLASSIDSGADALAADIMAKRQPQKSAVVIPQNLRRNATICLVSAQGIRIDRSHAGEVRVHYSAGNSSIALGAAVGVLRFEEAFAPALRRLLLSYPTPQRINNLPMPGFRVADANFNRRLLARSLAAARCVHISTE